MRIRVSPVRWAHLTLVFALGVLTGCSENSAPDDETTPVRASEVARIVPASEALAGAHVPSLDPAAMNDAEIEKALGTGLHCEFRYTNEGEPVLAVQSLESGAGAEGVVKLNGSLVVLRSTSVGDEFVLQDDAVRVALAPEPGEQADEPDNARRREATMVFEVGSSLRVGYRGYYNCVE